ncbi:hypothetical protein SMACR_08925 [Sordaria macrospora]|uniref:WGS project CABT00000000 data, contig 2.69 n=2 Tax=Sordaria macrospora TaxID=5147 RepID=F7WB46_SORMK|nr:uncharacterized protein SMAC_08925 [Sordaria macrospora k-hell]KAA8628602.1 hypothetical protein SMACR_08925 [Sordaria macrospora]KAH7635541.1 hypothetical protein B0T09DRAFT_329033 [Sordaria sp. MPI-SDFR-AT-0083]WPJ64023.1 hypothetical protein SMAC4_08925 [Sordaria macrospora]CCC14338.1 unnamed protein product [Sordaria macrospora k-hell]
MDRLRRMVPQISRRRRLKQQADNNNNNNNNNSDMDDNQRPHALDHLPKLPPHRRPITALPSASHAASLDRPDTTTFLNLPYELRYQIYLLVLADRQGLHVDMRYAQATGRPHTTEGAYFHEERWAWRASTCHRDPAIHPAFDRCGLGGPPPTACHLHPETTCSIGAVVMGLLLTCRQVYRESVEVLYARNTFYINTGATVLYTERLLVPKSAAMVTSLVFTITTNTVSIFAREQLKLNPGWEAYAALMGRLPVAFPGLRKLQIIPLAARRAGARWEWPANNILDVIEAPPEDRTANEAVKNKLLGYMDDTVMAYGGQLREASLVFERDIFDKYVGGDFAAAERTGSGENCRRYWRQLPLEGKELDSNKYENWRGYWIQRVPKLVEVWFDMTVDYAIIA